MKKELQLIFISLFLIACHSEIEIGSLAGEYKNLLEADNYVNLNLFPDSTFILVQSPNWGDIMISKYGRWKIVKKLIELEESEDLGDWVTYHEDKMKESDSLIVYIDKNLSRKIGSFRTKLNIDTVILENPTQLKFDKTEFYNRQNIAGLLGDKLSFYEYYPTELLIWNQDFFLKKWYVFSNNRIEISLDEEVPLKSKKSVLVKYRVVENGNLIPKGKHNEVVSEELSKRD